MPTDPHPIVADLRARLRGQVIDPNDPEYDDARTVFYGGIDRRPGVIVRPVDAAEVARVVDLAREAGSPLAVRGGGHSLLGHGVSDGGITLDLSAMRAIDVDPRQRVSWAEAGLTAGQCVAATIDHGLAVGFGDTGSVGIGGITLGGGVGYLTRKHGLTIDSLLAADLVTADGQLRRVDPQTHPDLFWAIRGGGGNFGVATRFKFRLHPVDSVVGGVLMMPATADVLSSLVAAAEAAPEELTTSITVMIAPPMPMIPADLHGTLLIMVLMCYTGPAEDGQRAVAPFRAVATPIVDLVRPASYPELFLPEAEGFHPRMVGRNLFLERVDHEVASTIIERVRASDAQIRAAQIRVLGGAVARVPADATAYAHRGSRIMANLGTTYEDAADRAAREVWIDDFAAALRQGDPGTYLNFAGTEGNDVVRAAYPGPTYDRLVRVKNRYDPTNLFRGNHNIPPDGGGSSP